MGLLNQHFDLLTRLLTASEQRQRVISNNIANVNTPGFKRLELKFEDALAKEISREDRGQKSVRPASASIQMTAGLPSRADGNNVDIDKEVGQLNKTALLQQMYLQLMGTELDQMRRAMQSK